MKIEKTKTHMIKNKKILAGIFILASIIFTGAFVGFVGVNDVANAKSQGRVSRPSQQPAKKSSSSYSAPKKVNGKTVTFSKSGCGNFNINGKHYGGSQSCKVLGKNCGGGNPGGPGGGPGSSGGGGGGGGGGGCASGQYYCDLLGQCIPNSEACNSSNSAYEQDKINPNIPATLGPVSLKNLSLVPPIGNKGYQCRVAWNNSFASYNNDTICTFTGPNVSMDFSPSDETAPLFYQSGNLTADTLFKMTCRQGTSDELQSIESVCRLNWDFVEIN